MLQNNSNLLLMKKIIILILISFWAHYGNCQQVKVVYPGYTSYYNNITHIPDSVTWVASPHKKVVGRESGFHPTGGRVNTNKDYAKSGYDQGHNCDASDENGDSTDEYNSFDQANLFPQKAALNRITWLALENYTRELNRTVKVKTSWCDTIGYLKPDNILIPKFCIKELWYNGQYEKYIMPNDDTVKLHPFTYYKIK